MTTMRRTYRWFALCACVVLLAGCAGPGRGPQSPTGGKADGRILFAVNGNPDAKDDGIFVLRDGGNPRKVIIKGSDDYALQYPRWSPDGQSVAYVRVQDRGAYSDLWIARENGMAQRQLTSFRSKIVPGNSVTDQGKYVKDSSIVSGVSWSRGSNQITFATDAKPSGYMRPWIAENPDVRPGDVRTYSLVATQNLPGDVQVDGTALSPDGNYMAFTATWPPEGREKKTQVFLLDFKTRKWTQLTDLPEGAYDPVWAPNSQYLVFAGRPGFRVNDLFGITRDGKNLQQITQTGAARAPAFSPDGKKLAFLSGAEGQFGIWTMDVTLPADANAQLGYGKPEKVFDAIKYIDARSGLAWAG